VPLNRPAETLAPGPRGALDARRWVVGVFGEIGRTDLCESAELAMSEVVTNAILHGKPPVTVRLRGTKDHPRVEVRDGSGDAPALPPRDPTGLYDDLPTFGRGLSIVASTSEAWGAERDDNGKLVWFVPSAKPPTHPSPGVLLGWDDEPRGPSFGHRHAMTIHLRHTPTDGLQATLAHGAELRRELRLLAVAHQNAYPVASDLSAYFSALARDFRTQLGGERLREAVRIGRGHIDLDVVAPADTEQQFLRLQELLDLADAFCRNERLLTLARSSDLVAFQSWLYGEFVRQARGEQPHPWSDDQASLSRAHP
jgi:anti-sigma regulatory factor (Ser/Thr protein kinase)